MEGAGRVAMQEAIGHVKFSFSSSLRPWGGDPEQYWLEVAGRIMALPDEADEADEAELAGTMETLLVRVAEAREDEVSLYAVFDSYDEALLDVYRALFNKNEDLRSSLGMEPFDHEILVIRSLQLESRWQDTSLGTQAVQRSALQSIVGPHHMTVCPDGQYQAWFTRGCESPILRVDRKHCVRIGNWPHRGFRPISQTRNQQKHKRDSVAMTKSAHAFYFVCVGSHSARVATPAWRGRTRTQLSSLIARAWYSQEPFFRRNRQRIHGKPVSSIQYTRTARPRSIRRLYKRRVQGGKWYPGRSQSLGNRTMRTRSPTRRSRHDSFMFSSTDWLRAHHLSRRRKKTDMLAARIETRRGRLPYNADLASEVQ